MPRPSAKGASATRPARNLGPLLATPWALHPETLSRIVAWGRSDQEIDPSALLALEGPHDGAQRVGSVAVIPVYGVIEHHSDWFMELFGEGASVDGLRESLRGALNDPDVKAIVLDIDSPGGGVTGVTELASEIRGARGGAKPIVAVANAFAASAAYWLASQADEVVATPSGLVGSIGVYSIHQDVSRMLDEMGVTTTIVSAGPNKTEGNEFEPLSDEAKAQIQERVDATYEQFVADVAAGRGVSSAEVKAEYGGGRAFNARKALAIGMVDRVESLGDTIARLSRPGARRRATVVALDAAADGSLVADHIVATALGATGDAGDPPPFTARVAAFASEATQLVEAAQHRARSRAAAGRPAVSDATTSALRASRDAIDALLLGKPEASAAPATTPGEPAPAARPTPPPAAIPVRFQSRADWLHYLESH